MKNRDNTQEKLRSIFRVAPTGIGFIKNRIIQEVNPRVCEMTGYSEEELIGQGARILYPNDEEYNYVGSEKYDQIARQGTGIVETRWQRKDGSIINVLLASTPIDTSDLSLGVAFTVLDFTERKQMQDALIESEKKYRILVENQTDLVVKLDTQGRFTFVSPSYCSSFGKTEKELLGKKFMPLVHKDDRKATEEAMKSLYAPPYTAYVEQRAMTINGWQWISWVDNAIRLENGDIEEIIGVGRNVTEKKIAEEKLEETKFGIDHAQIGVYQVEEDGTIKYANNYAAESVGYTTTELTGKSLFDIDSEFDHEKFKQHRNETKKKTSRTIISTHRRKDGTEFPVEVTINYFKFRDKLLSFSFVKDISERKQAEETLLESERKLSTLMDNQPGMAYRCRNDENWTMVFVSSGCKEVTGYEAESLLENKSISYDQMIHPDDRRMVRERIEDAIVKQEKFLLEYRITDSKGNERWVWEKGLWVNMKGEDDAFVEGFIMDITDEKRAAIELRKLKEELEIQVHVKTRELQERILELERFHQATIEREFRIKELRDEIERLKGEQS